MNKAFEKIYILFIVVNCLATFQFFGMPKMYINKHHFTGIMRHRYVYVCTPLKNMMVKDEKGNYVNISANDRLSFNEVDLINKQIDEAINENKAKEKTDEDPSARGNTGDDELFRVHVINRSISVLLTRRELYDPTQFKDVTEEANKEVDAAIALENAKGERKYNEYMLHQRFWFAFPLEYVGNYIMGLATAAFAFLVNFLIGRKHPALAVIVSLAMTGLKCMGIIYAFMHPVVCA